MASRKLLNPVLDKRVHEMVMHREFFREVLQFADQVAKEYHTGKLDEIMLKNSSLFNCIGFKETMSYLKTITQEDSLLD